MGHGAPAPTFESALLGGLVGTAGVPAYLQYVGIEHEKANWKWMGGSAYNVLGTVIMRRSVDDGTALSYVAKFILRRKEGVSAGSMCRNFLSDVVSEF